MLRLTFITLSFSLTAMAADLPTVSLDTAKWQCSSGTAIENGVATLKGSKENYLRVTLPIPAATVAGKNIRFSAEVKTTEMAPVQDLTYSSPKLKIVDGKNGRALGVNNFGPKPRPEWEEMFVETAIPKDRTEPLILELGLQSCAGTFQVRNVTLQTVKPWKWNILDAGAEKDTAAEIPPRQTSQEKKPNILFIAVDDLKPQLNCYGATQIKSPNLDRLAATGMKFTSAYCQQAVCSPSRTSLLTGLRPDSTQVYDLTTHFRENVPNVIALPQHFAQNGYTTMGMGKIYHGGLDDKLSWNAKAPRVTGKGYASEEIREYQAERREEGKAKGLKGIPLYSYSTGPPVECADVPDSDYYDGGLADSATQALQTLAKGDRPFFLGVGFHKPHLPFTAPKRYWDLYDRDKIVLADNPDTPVGAPDCAMHTFGELRSYVGMPKTGKISDEQARELIHGYYACVSFVDAQIGRVLDKLDRLKLRDNTIVILWGDHGWHLGDHGLWCKHTNFESATHVPMIVRVPWAKTAGASCDRCGRIASVTQNGFGAGARSRQSSCMTTKSIPRRT